MLLELHIKDYALVEEAVLEFGPGLMSSQVKQARKIHNNRCRNALAWRTRLP